MQTETLLEERIPGECVMRDYEEACMPLSPEQEALCERLEKGESTPSAAALIRRQARQIDDLWDRLSHAYALFRRESPSEMIQEEMEQLRAMLDDRRQLQTSG